MLHDFPIHFHQEVVVHGDGYSASVHHQIGFIVTRECSLEHQPCVRQGKGGARNRERLMIQGPAVGTAENIARLKFVEAFEMLKAEDR